MITEEEKRQHRVCFTGHRPEKLKRSEEEIRCDLRAEIIKAAKSGKNVFISGMARGVDMWGAQIVLELREEYSLKLICASPYKGAELAWRAEWQRQYREILDAADMVEFICAGYDSCCYHMRNKWMVDRSSGVIAVFNGEKGGTANTIKYAEKTGVPVCIISG